MPRSTPTTGIFTWAPPVGTTTITVVVSDNGIPAQSDEASFKVAVENVAPTVDIGADVALMVGATLTRTGTVADPGTDDQFAATVDYGDGSGWQPLDLRPGRAFELSHPYALPGTYPVSVSVTDKDGGVGASRFLVTVVAPASPVISAITDHAIDEGGIVAFVATTEPGTLGSLIYTLDPGAPAGAAIDPATGRFTFAAIDGPATYRLTVRVTEDGTPSLTDARTFTITVRNVAPQIGLAADPVQSSDGSVTPARQGHGLRQLRSFHRFGGLRRRHRAPTAVSGCGPDVRPVA